MSIDSVATYSFVLLAATYAGALLRQKVLLFAGKANKKSALGCSQCKK